MRKTILSLGVIALIIIATASSGCIGGKSENSDYPEKLIVVADIWPTHTWELTLNYTLTPEFLESLKFNNSHFDYKIINATYDVRIYTKDRTKVIDRAKGVPAIIIIYPMYGAIVRFTKVEWKLKNGKEVTVNTTEYMVYPLLPAYPSIYVDSKYKDDFQKRIAKEAEQLVSGLSVGIYRNATVVEIPKKPVSYVVAIVAPVGGFGYNKTTHRYFAFEPPIAFESFIIPRYIVEKYHPKFLYTGEMNYYLDKANSRIVKEGVPLGYKDSIVWARGKSTAFVYARLATIRYAEDVQATTGVDNIETFLNITENYYVKLLEDIGSYLHEISNYTVITESGKRIKFPFSRDGKPLFSYHIELMPTEDNS